MFPAGSIEIAKFVLVSGKVYLEIEESIFMEQSEMRARFERVQKEKVAQKYRCNIEYSDRE